MNVRNRVRYPHRVVRAAVYLCLGMAWTALSAGFAQELPFRHYQLPSPTATAIFQDSLGYMWFGVRDIGMVRYDGRNMEVVPELADGRVEVVAIEQDGKGRIWLATDGGLLLSEHPLSSYPHKELPRFEEDLDGTPLARDFEYSVTLVRHKDGSIWYGTPRSGIIRYRYSKDGHLKADTVQTTYTDAYGRRQVATATALAADGEGAIWAVFENGLIWKFPGSGLKHVVAAQPPRRFMAPTNRLHFFGNTLYGGTIAGTVWKLQDSVMVGVAGPYYGPVTDLTSDRIGRLWISTGGAGVIVLDTAGNNTTSIDPSKGMLDGQVSDTYIDRESNIWIAQYTGLSKLKADFQAFSIFSAKRHGGIQAALPSPEVTSVLPLKNSAYYSRALVAAGTTDGIAFLTEEGRTETVDFDNGLISNLITSLHRDRFGTIWIGTQSGINCIARYGARIPAGPTGNGHAVLFGNRMRVYGYDVGAVLNVREYPIKDGKGHKVSTVWAVGDTAIYCAIGNRWLAFDEPAGLPSTGNVDLFIDTLGFVYIANRKSGLFRSSVPLIVDSLESYPTHAAGMFDFPQLRRVRSRVFDAIWDTEELLSRLVERNGELYIGTDAGLYKFSGDVGSPTQILPNITSRIEAIAFHPHSGNAWLGTNKGLVEADLAGMQMLRKVSKNDGIAANGTWSGPMAVQCDLVGNVFQATGNGLSMYNPGMDVKNTVPPSVVLRVAEFTQDDFGNNEVVLGFLALSFANEEEVLYRTRLVGYDSAWSEPTPVGEIRFTNLLAVLSEKEYVFEVVACNNDGVWSEVPVTYAFTVMPPWWFRWYAMLLAPLFFTFVFLGWSRYRTAKLAKQNRALELTVLERTKVIAEKAIELETLDGIVKTINQETTLARVLDTIVSEAMTLFPTAEKGTFLIWDEVFQGYVFMAPNGYEPNVLDSIRLTEEELYARYIDTAERIGNGLYILRDTKNLPAQAKFTDVPIPQSMLIMAEEHEGTHEALLILVNMHSSDAFDLSDIQKLGRFREHAVSAISKAQILEDLTRKNEEIVRQQEQLATQEKLASLGALTAGIAHEIKNPLNFVTNFAKTSERMLSELDKQIEKYQETFEEEDREDVEMIIANLKQNAAKINEHGARADSIVKNMMLHSRGTANDRQRIKINSLVDEYVNLSFHGMRAQNSEFNITIERDYDEAVQEANVIPQDLSRVILNVVNNGSYAAWKKKLRLDGEFTPVIRVETRKRGNMFEIHIRDNGDGIPEENRKKIFEPFFTTKPTGEGTGLGLSMSYEIVVKEHGGDLRVDSMPGEWTLFTIAIPATY